MITIEPQTVVQLCSVPLEEDNLNVLSFSNAEARHNYFAGQAKYTRSGLTYIRDGSFVIVDIPFDQIIGAGVNYLFYKNIADSREYYCYVTNIEYVNENASRLTIATDVFTTWQFEINYKPVYVEREHTNNDAIGANTLPESLDLGEGVYNGQTVRFNLGGTSPASDSNAYAVMFQVSDAPNDGTSQYQGLKTLLYGAVGKVYNGLYSGLRFFGVLQAQANDIINAYQTAGLGDAIVSISYIPLYMMNGGTAIANVRCATAWAFGEATEFKNVPVAIQDVATSDTAQNLGSIEINPMRSLNGYTPKNNKLLTYPYCWYHATSNAGQDIIYKQELIAAETNGKYKFNGYGAVTQGAQIKLIPANYIGTTDVRTLFDYGINASKLPTLAWSSDYYLNYMAQNGMNLAVKTITNIGSQLVGAYGQSYNPDTNRADPMNKAQGAGLVMGIAGTVLNTMAEIDRVSKIPDQAEGNVTFGDLALSMKVNGFVISAMSIKAEYARAIDGYFSMFGYKTNQLKRPNVTGRRNWNYVKTIGANMDGNIPQGDLQTIRGMFDRGVTIWHNPATIYDYGQNNAII